MSVRGDGVAEIPSENIAAAIFFLRGQVRFPSDFMFQLSNQEFANLRRQFGTSSWGGRRHVKLRAILASHEQLARKLAALESRYDAQFRSVFDAIRELMSPDRTSRRSIGFAPWEDGP
jgi:hypothetical protein